MSETHGAITSSLTRLPAASADGSIDESELNLVDTVPSDTGIRPLLSLVEISLLNAPYRRVRVSEDARDYSALETPKGQGKARVAITKAWRIRYGPNRILEQRYAAMPLSLVGPIGTNEEGSTPISTVPPGQPSTGGAVTTPPPSNPGGQDISFTPPTANVDLTPVPEPGTLGVFGAGLLLISFGSRQVGRMLGRTSPKQVSHC